MLGRKSSVKEEIEISQYDTAKWESRTFSEREDTRRCVKTKKKRTKKNKLEGRKPRAGRCTLLWADRPSTDRGIQTFRKERGSRKNGELGRKGASILEAELERGDKHVGVY